MPNIQLTCPSCATLLKLPNPVPPGTPIKCPRCALVFRVAGAPAPAAAPPAAPRSQPPPAAARPPAPRPQPGAAPAPPAAARPRPPAAAPPPLPPRPAPAPAARPKPPPPPLAISDTLPADEAPLDLSAGRTPRRSVQKKSSMVWVLAGVGALLLVVGGAVATVFILRSPAKPEVAEKKGTGPGETPPDADKPPKDKPPKDPPDDPAPAPRTLDLSYIPADFNAALVTHPARIVRSPLLAGLPVAELFGDIEETGMDPRTVERVVVLVEPFPGGAPPKAPPPGQPFPPGPPRPARPPGAPAAPAFFPAFVIRFTAAVDGKQVLDRALHGVREATFKGKTYYRSDKEKMAGDPMAGFVANDRTVLVAPETTLKKMLGTEKADSPLLDRLRKIDLDHDDVVGVFVLEPFRDMLGAVLKQAQDFIPPPLAEAKTLHERLVAITFWHNPGREDFVKVTLEANNDESAAVLEKLVGAGLDFGKNFFPAVRQQIVAEAPPQARRAVGELADQLLAGIQVGKDGKDVVVSLKKPAALKAELFKSLLGVPDVATRVSAPNEPLRGDTKEVQGLKVTPVKLRANVLGCMFWADEKGTAFYALDPVGTIRKISFPDLKVVQQIELDKKCSSLAPSAEGLVVSVEEAQAVWLLDPEKGTVKRSAAVPGLKRAVSALSLSTAFASNGRALYEVDLKRGRASQYTRGGPRFGGYADPVMTPNGKYLFTRGGLEDMHRFIIKDGQAKFDQSSPRIAQGRVDIGVQVSPDSKFVSLPCYAGNYGAGGYGNVFVYPVENIERPEATLKFGGPAGMAFSADPATGSFYSHSQGPVGSQGLLVFDKEGKVRNNYNLEAGEVMQLLVHPAGGKIVVLGKGKFLLVEGIGP